METTNCDTAEETRNEANAYAAQHPDVLRVLDINPEDSRALIDWMNKQPPLDITIQGDGLLVMTSSNSSFVYIALFLDGCTVRQKNLPLPEWQEWQRGAFGDKT
jgi:hypothetical protein